MCVGVGGVGGGYIFHGKKHEVTKNECKKKGEK